MKPTWKSVPSCWIKLWLRVTTNVQEHRWVRHARIERNTVPSLCHDCYGDLGGLGRKHFYRHTHAAFLLHIDYRIRIGRQARQPWTFVLGSLSRSLFGDESYCSIGSSNEARCQWINVKSCFGSSEFKFNARQHLIEWRTKTLQIGASILDPSWSFLIK